MNKQEHHGHCCSEYDALSRRQLLRRGSTAAALAATTPAWLPRISLAQGTGLSRAPRDTFVSVFLRGGQDGLTAVPPYGDPDYYTARPNLAIQPPGVPNGAIDLDGFFGLAPAAAPLHTPYAAGHLLVVHATGSPDPSLSHFDSQRYMELAIPNTGGASPISTGWLARHLASTPPVGSGDLRALALGNLIPDTLTGAPGTLPIPDPGAFAFPGDPVTEAERRAALSAMYASAGEPLGSAAQSSLATIDLLEQIDFAGYVPANGAMYPDTAFGRALMSTAALIKAGVGIEAAHVDLGGWDHHNAQGPLNGIMAQLLDEMSRGFEAFYLDLQDYLGQFTLAAVTEFGRRIAENGSLGTDHGHGGVIWIMGGHVDGGRVLTSWPGLVGGNGNLAITIDYRDLLAEIVVKRLKGGDLGTVFPGYVPTFQDIIV